MHRWKKIMAQPLSVIYFLFLVQGLYVIKFFEIMIHLSKRNKSPMSSTWWWVDGEFGHLCCVIISDEEEYGEKPYFVECYCVIWV